MTDNQTTATALSALGYHKDWLIGLYQEAERVELYFAIPSDLLVSGEAARKRLAEVGFPVSRVENAIRPGGIPAPFWAGVDIQPGIEWQEIFIG